MPVKFYTDTHLDKAIAVQARQRGVDVIRCEEVGMATAQDFEHLAYAAAQGRTMISADADFTRLHAEWQASGQPHAGIIYIQPERKDDIGAIVAALEFLHQAIEGGAATLEEDVYNTLRYL
jgi:predicted nuclease of predicted toxin-antitoxin system